MGFEHPEQRLARGSWLVNCGLQSSLGNGEENNEELKILKSLHMHLKSVLVYSHIRKN